MNNDANSEAHIDQHPKLYRHTKTKLRTENRKLILMKSNALDVQRSRYAR
ncbi:hypothetical protein RchiOBHm_Chr6g0256681 [Rosa chinensis]|uniref:Uncharacterized protein n=1 Tax=Rosa chinensis TaxID=74649 RepID=A0A2P6PM65_ROSCH|nr:hypothetical protein RchiOBHm_Chr6g0256681 [Rosa chinensis]